MDRPILQYPNEVLSTKCHEVDPCSPEALIIAQELLETLALNGAGVGLSANQIGYEAAMFIWLHQSQGETKPRVICNPKVTRLGRGGFRITEGCLSYPGHNAIVTRADQVMLTGTYVGGGKVRMHLVGAEAIIVQHEYEHLQGKGLWDYEPKPIESIKGE